MNTEYRAGLYLRLSRDDDGKGESVSIGSQRALLHAYAKEHDFLIAEEYVDDGYSGTRFDRPAFQRMLADIEAQKINLILTKDLSRLGRDYIQTGQYTEIYFPAKKVRCIAVNDGFDSGDQQNDIAPFKNIVNEMYARDASRKIRSALSARRKEGLYLGSFAPYGYRKDPQNKNHLIPDEAAAPVVRTIFSLAAEGISPGEIAKQLNETGVLSPARARRILQPDSARNLCDGDGLWSSSAIVRVLKNIVYLGHTAQGKTTKLSFKSEVTLRRPPSDWVVVRNTHTPLVTEEQFALVGQRIKSRQGRRSGTFQNRFSGLAFCADCGHAMSSVGSRRRGAVANLVCGAYKLHGTGACSNHFIDYTALETLVIRSLRTALKLDEAEQAALLQKSSSLLVAENTPASDVQLQTEQAKLTRLIAQLYEDRAAGRLSDEHFYPLLTQFEQRSRELMAQHKLMPHTPALRNLEALPRILREITSPDPLDTDLLFTFVERIEVGQGSYVASPHGRIKQQTVKISFRFSTTLQTREYWL